MDLELAMQRLYAIEKDVAAGEPPQRVVKVWDWLPPAEIGTNQFPCTTHGVTLLSDSWRLNESSRSMWEVQVRIYTGFSDAQSDLKSAQAISLMLDFRRRLRAAMQLGMPDMAINGESFRGGRPTLGRFGQVRPMVGADVNFQMTILDTAVHGPGS